MSRVPRLGLLVPLLLLAACSSNTRVAQLERRVDSLAVTVTALVNARRNAGAAVPESASVEVKGAATAGDATAPVVIVEFTDYQCPFCSRHAHQTLPMLRANYISTGKVRYVIRDLPIREIHPHAVRAAVAARCAQLQGGDYWGYHDALFNRQREITDTLFAGIARELGLDLSKFRACIGSRDVALLVERDAAEAKRVGLTGTPAFIIGRPAGDGTVRGVVIKGAYPYEEFQRAIDAALSVTTARR